MSQNQGWIKLHRTILDHWIYKDPNYFSAWVKILMTVNHQNKKVLIEKTLIECKRGESVLSIDSWSKLFGRGWTPQKTKTFFFKLKNDAMINLQGMQYSTKLSVCNYETYQNDQRTNNEPITNQQLTGNELITTTKEGEERKERKERKEYLSPSAEVLEKEISPLIHKPVKNQINYPQDFENFWTAYQHKGSKKPALAQWLKLNPDQKLKSIEKLPEYFLERPEISFRKDAERYLRDMVWEKYSSTNLNAFSIPQNVKTGNANGRNLPDKKTWAEFQEFCNTRDMQWTKEIDIRLAYTEVPFDCWGKMYLTDFLRDFSKRKKEVI